MMHDQDFDRSFEFSFDKSIQREWRAFFAMEYWNRLRCSDLPHGVNLAVFDFAAREVGTNLAARCLQRAVGFVGGAVDGWIGPETIMKARDFPVRSLIMHLIKLQDGWHSAQMLSQAEKMDALSRSAKREEAALRLLDSYNNP